MPNQTKQKPVPLFSLVYKCRQCGAIVKNNAMGEAEAERRIIDAINLHNFPTRFEDTINAFPIISFHRCGVTRMETTKFKSLQLGIMDLIGSEEE